MKIINFRFTLYLTNICILSILFVDASNQTNFENELLIKITQSTEVTSELEMLDAYFAMFNMSPNKKFDDFSSKTKKELLKRELNSAQLLGRITATTSSARYYYAYYSVGNQGPLVATVDTGATSMWLNNIDYSCTPPICTLSSTPSVIEFPHFNVTGFAAHDDFNFGGLIAEEQGFTYVTNSKNVFIDGWLSLGINSGARFPSILDNLKAQNKISSRSFSIYLANFTGNKNDALSNIIFGAYDPLLLPVNTSFLYIPLLTNTVYWTIKYQGATFGNIDVGNSARGAIVDCGVNHIQFVQNDWINVYASIISITPCVPGSEYAEYECYCPNWNTVLKFPNITLKLGDAGYDFILTPQHYLTYNQDRKVCSIWLRLRSDSNTVMTLGTPFFNAYYMHFNQDNRTIGFAHTTPKSCITNYIYNYIVVVSLFFIQYILFN